MRPLWPVVILARGGSKGLPNKNLMRFCGRPLISWTIDYALRCSSVSGVWVSTDSEAIGLQAAEDGANVIWRPHSLATDTTPSEDAWLHALDSTSELAGSETLIGMQATSPLRLTRDLDVAIDIFAKKALDCLFSGSELDELTLWHASDGQAPVPVSHPFGVRTVRQQSPRPVVENGSFYIMRCSGLRALRSRFFGTVGYSPNHAWQMAEIDSAETFEICEVLMRHFVLPEYESLGW